MAQRRRRLPLCERKYDLVTQRLLRTHSSESEDDDPLALQEQEEMLKRSIKPHRSKFAHPWTWDVSSETSEDSSEAEIDKPKLKSIRIKKKELQRARKKLKHVELPLVDSLPSSPSSKSSIQSQSSDLFLKLPSSFSWRNFPGLAQPTNQSSWGTCTIETILTCMADQFLIAQMVTQPVQFSSQYLLANYNRHPRDPLLKLEEDSYLHSSNRIIGGIEGYDLLYFIQQQGITTTRCMGMLPTSGEIFQREEEDIIKELIQEEKEAAQEEKVREEHQDKEKMLKSIISHLEEYMKRYILNVPKCSCFIENKNLYTFHVSEIRVLATDNVKVEEEIKSFKTIQDVMKRHIYRYGPIMSVFDMSTEFKRLYDNTDVRLIQSQLYTEYNPEGIFFEIINYNQAAGRRASTSVSFLSKLNIEKEYHAISVVGWGVAPVSNSVLTEKSIKLVYPPPYTKENMTHIPYWLCRNSWSTNTVDGGWVKIAMFPFNRVISLEGNRSKESYRHRPNTRARKTHSYVCLFKPGEIRRNAQFLKAINPTSDGEYNFKCADLDFYKSPDPVVPRYILPPKNPFTELGAIVDKDSYDIDSTKAQSMYPFVTNFQKARVVPLKVDDVPIEKKFKSNGSMMPPFGGRTIGSSSSKSKKLVVIVVIIIVVIIFAITIYSII